MFSKKPIVLAAALLSFNALFADDLDVARQALRDGLYSVARNYALKVDATNAWHIIAESYAKERKWDAVMAATENFPDKTDDAFVYYKSFALLRMDKADDAFAAMQSHQFSAPGYPQSATLLKAEIAHVRDMPSDIIELSKLESFPKDDPDAMELLAWAQSRSGNSSAATSLWRKIVSMGEVSDATLSSAAWNLNDVESLSNAFARVKTSLLKIGTGLRLGCAMLADASTFDTGEELIRRYAKESPDAEGAMESFIALAQGLLDAGQYAKSAEAFKTVLDTWPAAAKIPSVQEGRGWALWKSDKTADALESFAFAEKCATNDTDKARIILAQGDVLSDLGRGGESMEKYREVVGKYAETPSGKKLKIILELRAMESEGRALYGDFRFEEAMKVFKELAKRDPKRSPRMEYFEVLCLYGLGKDDEAAEKAKRIADGSPDADVRAEATLWIAKLKYNANRWKEACGLFANYATNLAPRSVKAPDALGWAAKSALAARDYALAISLVTALSREYPDSSAKNAAWLTQGEALVETARLDEAILVFEKVAQDNDASSADRFKARLRKADILFVMGADNPVRYREALEEYRSLRLGETLSPDEKLSLAYKIGRTLENLNRQAEAVDQYYGEVVCAYRDNRRRGVVHGEEGMTTFARAAFRLADDFERRGENSRAVNVLLLVVQSDVTTAVPEAERRMERLQRKGLLQ